jgi:outer membrane protein TolC
MITAAVVWPAAAFSSHTYAADAEPAVLAATVAPAGSNAKPGGNSTALRLDSQATDSSMILPGTPARERSRFEHRRGGPLTLIRQWGLTERPSPDHLTLEPEFGEQKAMNLSLKEALYLALRNSPRLTADNLEPLVSLEGVRRSAAVFDPTLGMALDESKSIAPTTSILRTGGDPAFSRKEYEWNFGVGKLLSSTNGTFGVNFTNNRLFSNSIFASLAPAYTPSLTLSLSQPLLRNFGFRFATINLRIAELRQKGSQYQYEKDLSDFVLRVATEYWLLVRAEENRQIARQALQLAKDLLRQDDAVLGEGMVAELAVKEASAAVAGRDSGVATAEDGLNSARAALAEDVMAAGRSQVEPPPIEPLDRGGFTLPEPVDRQEDALETAMEFRPELEVIRQGLGAIGLKQQYAENQTLPQLDLQAQFGVSAAAGTTPCLATSASLPGVKTCTLQGPGLPRPGGEGPFGGTYGDALNRLWGFKFYNYAVGVNLQVPLMNDSANAALAQTRIENYQEQLHYRDQVAQIVAEVQTALGTVKAAATSAEATKAQAAYALEALVAETARYNSGLADTHELLQYQSELVTAQGNRAEAQVGLQLAGLKLLHAQGILLRTFQISFTIQDPRPKAWYTSF